MSSVAIVAQMCVPCSKMQELAVLETSIRFVVPVFRMLDSSDEPSEAISESSQTEIHEPGELVDSAARERPALVPSRVQTISPMLRPGMYVILGRLKLRHALTGKRICWPGVTTLKNAWTVPEWALVRALLGVGVFALKDDLTDIECEPEGEPDVLMVSAVQTKNGLIAHSTFTLEECAVDEEVGLVIGKEPLPFCGLPFDEVEPSGASEASTPPTPNPYEL